MKTLFRYQLLIILVVCTLIGLKYTNMFHIGRMYNEESAFQRNLLQIAENPVPKRENYSSGYSVPMAEHIRFYNLDPEVHYSCPNVKRPKPEHITWRKNTYQNLKLKFGDYPERDMFGMKCYFDDRFIVQSGQRHIRCILSIDGLGKLGKTPEANDWLRIVRHSYWRLLLWYEGFEDPVGVRCTDQPAAGLSKNVSNKVFFQETLTCIIPEIGILPESTSIVTSACDLSPKTNFEIVYPEVSKQPYNRELGLCMACMYGSLNDTNVVGFVNWMEGLKLFGINEVTLNNCSVKFLGNYIHKTFQYYQDIGRLTFTHFPTIHQPWEMLPSEEYHATEAVNKITTGDCVYRNIKRYWYVFIADIDELPVPTNFDTYQEFLTDYFKRHPNLTLAHSVAVRSAYFLSQQEPGNPEYGEHLPFLRLTKRFRPEPMETDGVGVSKSFHNTRNLVGHGQHLTRQTHEGGRADVINHFLPPEEILIHHFRSSCKYKSYCDEHWNDTIHDDILPRKYGHILQERIEHALNEIGYPF